MANTTTHPDLIKPIRTLRCCCCGAWTKGRQFHNQDNGFGLGSCCVEYVRAKTPEMEGFVQRTYGVAGVHYGLEKEVKENETARAALASLSVERWMTSIMANATKDLIQRWDELFSMDSTDNMADDVTVLIGSLEIFRARARQILPIKNGGFGGYEKSLLIERLSLASIEVYTAEDGNFGYTNCDSDCFDTFDEALNRALQANPDIVASLGEVAK